MASTYYRTRRSGLFQPDSTEPYRLSRSKIDLFLRCPRCFYLDRRLGIGQPPSFPFNLNSAVDTLLKKEFDLHRAAQTKHPLFEHYGLDAVPYQHPSMDTWRDSLRAGITYRHPATNLLITGGVDDVWQNPAGELLIVDYKSTSKAGEVSLDADWQIGYKRQMEVYQWLFRQNGFPVSETGYFVYCNGSTDREAFDAKLEFSIKLIPYLGQTDWIEPAIMHIRQTLDAEAIPEPAADCDFCTYAQAYQTAVGANPLSSAQLVQGTLL